MELPFTYLWLLGNGRMVVIVVVVVVIVVVVVVVVITVAHSSIPY